MLLVIYGPGKSVATVGVVHAYCCIVVGVWDGLARCTGNEERRDTYILT